MRETIEALERAERIHVREIKTLTNLPDEWQRTKEAPRVIKGKDMPWRGGPLHWVKNMLTPDTSPCQSLYSHVDDYAPGSYSQKHGHMNEAMFYILEGRGYDVHDGERHDWEAGDVCIVHNGTVHQHFNADPQRPARALIIKPKPLYMFLNLICQAQVEPNPKGPSDYRPRDP